MCEFRACYYIDRRDARKDMPFLLLTSWVPGFSVRVPLVYNPIDLLITQTKTTLLLLLLLLYTRAFSDGNFVFRLAPAVSAVDAWTGVLFHGGCLV
jgi:hypothetical protein